MGWFVFLAITILLEIGVIAAQKALHRISDEDRAAPPLPMISKIAGAIVALVFVIVTGSSMFHKVNNGHVALVYRFGAIVSQRGDGTGGYVFTLPWESVSQVNVQVQKIVPQSDCADGTKSCLDAASNESQDVFVSPSINIKVDPQNIQTLFRTVGPDYINVLVEPRIAQVTKEETAKYKSTDIIPNRATLRTNIATELTKELSGDSITVTDFLITDVHFSQGFNTAIEAKTTAEQNAQTEQNNVAIHTAQAQQKVADAKGQADATVALAEGQAEANQDIASSLTPELIEWQSINTINPKATVIYLPSSTLPFINVGQDNSGLGTGGDQPTK